MPALRAFSMVGTIAVESLGTIRMPLAPAAISCSMAATCPSLSPSNLPARACVVTPSSLALASKPSFILTKKGLVLVLVMSPTRIGSACARAHQSDGKSGGRDGRENSRNLGHRFPPSDIRAAASIVAAVARTLRALAHCDRFRAVVLSIGQTFGQESRIITSDGIILDIRPVRHNHAADAYNNVEAEDEGGAWRPTRVCERRARGRRRGARLAARRRRRDERRRRESGGRAALQRAAAALARAPLWSVVQDRSREIDGTVGAIDLSDHEPAAGGRAVEAGGSVARPGWTADDPHVDRSRRRLFVRAQNRAAQLRSGADRFPRRHSPARSPRVRVSDANHDPRFCPDSLPSLSDSLTTSQKRRIAGLGVAAPFQLWSWEAEIGAPHGRNERLAAFRRGKRNRRRLPLSDDAVQ